MSKEFKKHYSSFNRNILKEFFTEEELTDLDKIYSKAKLHRMTKKMKKFL